MGSEGFAWITHPIVDFAERITRRLDGVTLCSS
jgi:hypothetical protein